MARPPRPDPIKNIPPLDENLVSNKLIEELSELIGKPFPPAEIGTLDTLCRQYLIDKHLVDGRRPPGQVKQSLEKVKVSAEKLHDALNGLEHMSLGQIYISAMERGEGTGAYPFIDRFRSDLEKLTDWTQAGILRIEQSGPLKTGQRDLVALEWLINGLKGLFENVAGTKAKRASWNYDGEYTYGFFIKFCHVIIKGIDPKRRITIDGLDTIIKKVIIGSPK